MDPSEQMKQIGMCGGSKSPEKHSKALKTLRKSSQK